MPWPGDAANYWTGLQELAAPFRKILDDMAPAAREQARAEVVQAVNRYYDGHCVNFPAQIVLVTGVRE